MRKIAYITMSLTLIFLLSGCILLFDTVDGHREIVLVNKTGVNISYQISERDISEITMDTMFYCKAVFFRLEKDSSRVEESPDFRQPWEVVLGSDSYLELLVFDDETFMKYVSAPCEVVRQNVPILHAYRLTLSDLEKANWVIRLGE